MYIVTEKKNFFKEEILYFLIMESFRHKILSDFWIQAFVSECISRMYLPRNPPGIKEVNNPAATTSVSTTSLWP